MYAFECKGFCIQHAFAYDHFLLKENYPEPILDVYTEDQLYVKLFSGAALIQQSGILRNDGGKMSLHGKSIMQQSGELLTGILEMIASNAF